MRRDRRNALVAVAIAGLTGCTSGGGAGGGAGGAADPAEPTPTTATTSTPTSPTPSAQPATPPPARVDAAAAFATVRLLAGVIGTRETTSASYRRAAAAVVDRFTDLGYDVVRQRFRVPAGVSWGVDVPAGGTANVVATPGGFDPRQPHLLVGAHLDTVPQAPGAEDNASGVAVLLELARLAAEHPTRRPVVFVAFGAEEPRGPGDDQHHYGSRAYVDATPPAQRRALDGMVSLDRVGTGSTVPVCTGGLSPRDVQRALLRGARRVGVPSRACDNRTSDHWPFEKAGETVARVGGNDYAAYHSERDRPAVVRPRQLERTGALVWEWLTG